jgi:hypothetical protein
MSGRQRRGQAGGVPLAGRGRQDRGGGFVLGDYENNSIKCRRAECERIFGLLDRILEAASMLDDREGGGSSLLFTAAADCSRRMATSNKDDQQRFTAKPLLALTQRERASDLHRSRDATFWRRVDTIKFLSLARDFCQVLTKISLKPQKSFLAVEMVLRLRESQNSFVFVSHKHKSQNLC